MFWNLYAGLDTALCPLAYRDTIYSDSKEDALEAAYQYAVEIYKQHEGSRGVPTWQDCKDDLLDLAEMAHSPWAQASPNWPVSDALVDEYYQEEIDDWVRYDIVPADDDPTHDYF